MKRLLIGPHLSIAHGFAAAVEAATSINASAMQLFTKSNRSWFAPKIEPAEIQAFREAMQRHAVEYVAVHACYLINLASAKPEVVNHSFKSLKQEMQRCAALGIQDLILHPGAHTGLGQEKGLEQLIEQLRLLLSTDQTGVRILLENMAGQGTVLGVDFAELATVLRALQPTKQLGFCLDTCHAFAAGYDLVDAAGWQRSLAALEQYLGFANIHAVHFNDSQMPFASQKDRHANLGKGYIGLQGLVNLLRHPKLGRLPLLLETPDINGLEGYAAEVALVRQLSSE